MYCLRYSTAQQSVTVTSLGIVSIFLYSLYSIFFTFLGTLYTLDWSLYSMIFFSKGTYSILLYPFITSLPVFTVVPTTWALVVVMVAVAGAVEVVQQPPPTAYSLPRADDPVPQTQLVDVGGTQLEVVVTQEVLGGQLEVLGQLANPMGYPVLPSMSWLLEVCMGRFKQSS